MHTSNTLLRPTDDEPAASPEPKALALTPYDQKRLATIAKQQRVAAWLDRWTSGPFSELPKPEQAIRRAIVAAKYTRTTKRAIGALISNAAPRARIPHRDELIEVVRGFVEHLTKIRRTLVSARR